MSLHVQATATEMTFVKSQDDKSGAAVDGDAA